MTCNLITITGTIIAVKGEPWTADSLPPDSVLPDWPPSDQWHSDQWPSDQWPPSTPPILTDHGFHVSLRILSFTDSKCVSEFTRFQLQRSASPNGINLGRRVLFWVHLRSRSPIASLSSLEFSLQVHIQTRSIMASSCIFKVRLWFNRDTIVTQVPRMSGSLYLPD